MKIDIHIPADSGLSETLHAGLVAAGQSLSDDRMPTFLLHLETRNPKARVLYDRLGYRIFGGLPDHEGDLPFCYMVKTL